MTSDRAPRTAGEGRDNVPGNARDGRGDDGAALVLILVAMVVCSLIIVPVLTYASAVTRSSVVTRQKTIRQEAVKGGLRTALADPSKLFETCKNAGPNSGVTLAGPGLSQAVTTKCYKMADVTAEDPAKLRFARAAVQAGATVPASTGSSLGQYPGTSYPGSGNPLVSEWISAATKTTQFEKVWLPDLPAHALSLRSATPYAMPNGYTNPGFSTCTVFFPGTYVDPITISSSTPVFFTSGIYYFENAVTITGNARVVAGDGAIDGCTTDQQAAFNATGAPVTHNITGLGATFVFGAAGRLVVDNTVAGNPSLVFNRRYVAETDVSTATSLGVSILSVNGLTTAGTSTDLVLPHLVVQLSQVGGSTPVAAPAQEYKVSTLVPPALPLPAPTPIVDINLTSAATVKLDIPGYVAVPQGAVRLNVVDATGKTISLGGGMVAAQIAQSGTMPPSLLFGIDNPFTQKVFKIVSETPGTPHVTSTAIVQVNSNGGYAVNSWEVQ